MLSFLASQYRNVDRGTPALFAKSRWLTVCSLVSKSETSFAASTRFHISFMFALPGDSIYDIFKAHSGVCFENNLKVARKKEYSPSAPINIGSSRISVKQPGIRPFEKT